MNQIATEIITNRFLGLTATDRLIVLIVAEYSAGMRLEEIARLTGSRYRWVARQVSALTQMGVLRRVAPGIYALNDRSESQP